MLARFARSLAAGCAVGVVVQEALWAGLGMADPDGSLNRALVAGPQTDGIWFPLLTSWLLGGATAGLMATLVGRRQSSGHLAGALMSVSALVLCRLAWPESGALVAVCLTPSLGAALGSGLGQRVVSSDAARPAQGGVDTLHDA